MLQDVPPQYELLMRSMKMKHFLIEDNDTSTFTNSES